MTNGDDIDDIVEDAQPDYMENWEDQRQEAREQVDYEWCLLVRDAGELFRNVASIQTVAEELGIDEELAEEAVRLYIQIFSSDFDGDIFPGMEAGIRFFRSNRSAEELLEVTIPESPDDVRLHVREFVGSVILRYPDLEDADLTADIPETPERAPPREEMAELFDGTLQAAVQQMRNPLVGVDFSSFVAPQFRFEEIISEALVGAAFEEMLESMREQLQSTFEDVQVIIERQRELERTLREGISNFEHPREYSPDDIDVSDGAERVAVQMMEDYLAELEDADVDDVQPYYSRMRIGLDRYQDGEYMLSIFLFLSVQDGLLGMLVDEFGVDEGRQVERKETAFQQGYRHFLLSGEEAASTWSDFWQHRNAIMHGDKDVYFDRNIATISLLFLDLALYSVLDVLTELDEE